MEITWRADIYSGAQQATSAAAFGTQGINFRARKPAEQIPADRARQEAPAPAGV